MENKTDWKAYHKEEIVSHVKNFYSASWNWRSSSKYHESWDRRERNYLNIYDPSIKAKKLPYQATMFVPMTVTHCEVISAGLTKLLIGHKRVMTLEPREGGDKLQASLHGLLIDYELEKSDFVTEFCKCLRESCIFGSGFMKFYWKKQSAPRRIFKQERVGIAEGIKTNKIPGTKKNPEEKIEQVLIKDNVVCEKIHIRDIFLEPNAMDLQRLIHRNKITYGELHRWSKDKYVDKDSVEALRDVKEDSQFEEDLKLIKSDQGISDTERVAVDYDKKHTVWEYWGPIPRKWVDLEMPEDTKEQQEKANEIVEGKILVASGGYFLASEENPFQSMTPPFLKMDYIPGNTTYGIGVAQLIEGLQEELNEARNLRMDNVLLALNKVFVADGKKLVDIKQVQSVPGRVIQTKNTDDVKKVIQELTITDVAFSAFKETFEIERQAQEATAANRVTSGSAGAVKDANQTLGGMELMKQAAYDRFTVYAYQIGQSFITKSAKKIIELIYQNSGDERIQRILGIQPIEITPDKSIPKYQTFKKIPPHELELNYDFKAVDVFSMENQQQKRAALGNDMQLTASIVPQFDPVPALKMLYKLDGFTEEEVQEILKGLGGPMPTPLAMGQGVPSLAKTGGGKQGQSAPPPVTMGGAA